MKNKTRLYFDTDFLIWGMRSCYQDMQKIRDLKRNKPKYNTMQTIQKKTTTFQSQQSSDCGNYPDTIVKSPLALPDTKKRYATKLFPNAGSLATELNTMAAKSNGGEYTPLWMLQQHAESEIKRYPHANRLVIVKLTDNKLSLGYCGLLQLEIEERDEFVMPNPNDKLSY